MPLPSKEIRTRFAPSPTGSIHIGAIRTALFNYFYAKTHNGKFILRIEDTDLARNVSHSETEIIKTLTWLNIIPDEGPHLPRQSPYAPYRQSERLPLYQKVAHNLIEQGLAYPCFCSNEELKFKQQQAKKRGVAYVYDGSCYNLSSEEIKNKKNARQSFSIRFRIATDHIIRIDDLVQGVVTFQSQLIGDFIIIKSNGFPSYNFAVVVDDHAMDISHIIRGVGHLSNTPRQIVIFKALNYPLPRFAHIPEIVGTDRKKLSKRRNAISVLNFQKLGYLPQALSNYMALLGWNPKDGQEFYKTSIPPKFDVAECSKSPAFLDIFRDNKNDLQEFNVSAMEKQLSPKSKLNHLNNLYLQQKSPLEIYNLLLQLNDTINTKSGSNNMPQKLFSPELRPQMKHAIGIMRAHVSRLNELLHQLSCIFFPNLDQNENQAILADTENQKLFTMLLEKLNQNINQKDYTPEYYKSLLLACGKKLKRSGHFLFVPVRVALISCKQGFEVPQIMAILGKKEVINRLQQYTQ